MTTETENSASVVSDNGGLVKAWSGNNRANSGLALPESDTVTAQAGSTAITLIDETLRVNPGDPTRPDYQTGSFLGLRVNQWSSFTNIYFPYNVPVRATAGGQLIPENITSYAPNSGDIFRTVIPTADQTAVRDPEFNPAVTASSKPEYTLTVTPDFDDLRFTEFTFPASQMRSDTAPNGFVEVKGYFQAQSTGVHVINAAGGTGFIWISGVFQWSDGNGDELDTEEYLDLSEADRANYFKVWTGIDDQGYLAGRTPESPGSQNALRPGEYFTQDGWKGLVDFGSGNAFAADGTDGFKSWLGTGVSGTKQYHWDNAAIRLVGTNDVPTAAGTAQVFLEEGRYYFIRGVTTWGTATNTDNNIGNGAPSDFAVTIRGPGDSAARPLRFSGENADGPGAGGEPPAPTTLKLCDSVLVKNADSMVGGQLQETNVTYIKNDQIQVALNVNQLGLTPSQYGDPAATIRIGVNNYTVVEFATTAFVPGSQEYQDIQTEYQNQITAGSVDPYEFFLSLVQQGFAISWSGRLTNEGALTPYDYLYRAEPILSDICNPGQDRALVINPPAPTENITSRRETLPLVAENAWSTEAAAAVANPAAVLKTLSGGDDLGPGATRRATGDQNIDVEIGEIASLPYTIVALQEPEIKYTHILNVAPLAGETLSQFVYWFSWQPGSEPISGTDVMFHQDPAGSTQVKIAQSSSVDDSEIDVVLPNATATIYFNYAQTTETTGNTVPYSTVVPAFQISRTVTNSKNSLHPEYQDSSIKVAPQTAGTVLASAYRFSSAQAVPVDPLGDYGTSPAIPVSNIAYYNELNNPYVYADWAGFSNNDFRSTRPGKVNVFPMSFTDVGDAQAVGGWISVSSNTYVKDASGETVGRGNGRILYWFSETPAGEPLPLVQNGDPNNVKPRPDNPYYIGPTGRTVRVQWEQNPTTDPSISYNGAYIIPATGGTHYFNMVVFDPSILSGRLHDVPNWWDSVVPDDFRITTAQVGMNFRNADINIPQTGIPGVFPGARRTASDSKSVSNKTTSTSPATNSTNTAVSGNSGSSNTLNDPGFVACCEQAGVSVTGGTNPPREWVECYVRHYGGCNKPMFSPMPPNFSDLMLTECLARNGYTASNRTNSSNQGRTGVDTPLPNPNGADVTDNTQDSVITVGAGPGTGRSVAGQTSNNRIADAVRSGTGIATTRGVLTGERKYGNYSGYSNMPQTGNKNLYPSAVKKNNTRVINPSKYGFEIPLTDDQFVNATTVRTTGGKLVKFSEVNTLNLVSRTPTPLKVEGTLSETFNRVLPSNLGRTYRNVYYDPRSVGNSFSSGGRRIQNRRNGALTATPLNTDTALVTGSNSDIPVGVDPKLESRQIASNSQGSAVPLPNELQPVDNSVVFSSIPPMRITPVDVNGDQVGPGAVVTPRNATPRVEIAQKDFAGVQDGSELYIAGTKVVIKGQDPIPSLNNQLAENSLINSYVGLDENGEPKLIIESCQNSPFAIANGCAGGELRQVGDFHVNKGFEQTKEITSVYIPQGGNANGELTVNIPTIDASRDAEADNTSNFAKTGRLVDLDFNLSDYNRNWDLKKDGGNPDIVTEIETTFQTPSFFPQETVIQSRAGVGYRKGDRLRLVGGTPVNSNKGPLTRIIVTDPGIGYINPADISVIIGDGTTPGVGAAAEVISLNAAGGIGEIRMLNYGVGYDPSRPPVITFQDSAPAARRSVVNAAQYNQTTLAVLNPGSLVKHRVDTIRDYVPGQSQVTLEVIERYYRVSDLLTDSIQVGGTRVTEATNITRARDASQHTPYELDIVVPSDFTVQPGSYITLNAQDNTATLPGTNTVNNLPELLVVQRNGNTITVHSPSLAQQTVADAVLERWQESSTDNPVEVIAAVEFPAEFLINSMIAVANPNLGQRDAEARAIIGLAPDADINNVGNTDYQNPFYGAKDETGYAALAGPLRVAKFLVTDVDDEGAITALKILDRGLYKVFPSDLTLGIPLEYDYEPLGVPSSVGGNGSGPALPVPAGDTNPLPNVAPRVSDIPQLSDQYRVADPTGNPPAFPGNVNLRDDIDNAYIPQSSIIPEDEIINSGAQVFLQLNGGNITSWPLTLVPDSQGTYLAQFGFSSNTTLLGTPPPGTDPGIIYWFSETPGGSPLPGGAKQQQALTDNGFPSGYNYQSVGSSSVPSVAASLGVTPEAQWEQPAAGGVVYFNMVAIDRNRMSTTGDYPPASGSEFVVMHNDGNWWETVDNGGWVLPNDISLNAPRWQVAHDITEQALIDAGIGNASSAPPAVSGATITVGSPDDLPDTVPALPASPRSGTTVSSAGITRNIYLRSNDVDEFNTSVPENTIMVVPFRKLYSRVARGSVRFSNASSNTYSSLLYHWLSAAPGGTPIGGVDGIGVVNSTGIGISTGWSQAEDAQGQPGFIGHDEGVVYWNLALLREDQHQDNLQAILDVNNALSANFDSPRVDLDGNPVNTFQAIDLVARPDVPPLETGTVYGGAGQSVNSGTVDPEVLTTAINAIVAAPPPNVVPYITGQFNQELEDGTRSSYGPVYGGSVGNRDNDWLPVYPGTVTAVPISFRAGMGVGTRFALRTINMNMGFFLAWFSDVPGDWDNAYTDESGEPWDIPAEGTFAFTQQLPDEPNRPQFAGDEDKLIWFNVCQIDTDSVPGGDLANLTTALLQGSNPPLRDIDSTVFWNIKAIVRFFDLTTGDLLMAAYEELAAPSVTPQQPTRTLSGATTTGNFVRSNDTLGGVDPLRNNILYGGTHPEYFQNGAVADTSLFNTIAGNTSAGAKHRDWADFTEFKSVDGNRVEYYGTPGAYDPSTYVLDSTGQALAKTNELIYDEINGTWSYREPRRLAGGRGARVFLTADIVPDCSERGRAKEVLGLPDQVSEVNVPQTFVEAVNQGLADAGYLPEDIRWEVLEPDSPIPQVNLVTNYPGVKFDGFDWFGIPDGVYNNDILCLTATLTDRNLTDSQIEDRYEQLLQDGLENNALGLIQETGVIPADPQNAVPGIVNQRRYTNTAISLLCVDTLQTDPNSVFGNLGNSFDSDVKVVRELYQYDLTDIFGGEFRLTDPDKLKQDVDVFYFHSQRYQDREQYEAITQAAPSDTVDNLRGLSNTHVDLPRPEQAWIDSYTMAHMSDAQIQARYPGFINGGWVYMEGDTIKRWQTGMVDTKYIHNALIYNPETGNKTVDLDFWDPFKGILPGFIRKEIHYINNVDPVSINRDNNPEGQYDLDRSGFGRNNVGQLWWDTSTIKYNWYEQGTNRERWQNWGSAFPGSIVTISEWVESRARPQNYSGDGVVRFTQPYRYVKERHYDPETQQYETYYYYWVQNRTQLDPRLVENLGRRWDARTVARYIADPVNYGIPMISFINDNSVMFSNITDSIRNDDNHVQINLSRDLDPNGIRHSSWKLLREGDVRSVVPDQIVHKMIDSLAGENAIGQVVPDPGLSTVQRYGIQVRPRQSAFRLVHQAREIMAYVLNDEFADLNLYTQYPGWDRGLPAENTWQYLERTTWYAVDYVDQATQEKVRYDDSYKPVFNVDNVSDLRGLIGLPDGTVVQVGSASAPRRELWIYHAERNDFSRIAITGDTVRWRDSVYTDEINSQMGIEIRAVLESLLSNQLMSLNIWNRLFFELLKYAYMEQGQLDWAFKTTYLYVNKNEQDLVQIPGFKPDTFDSILEYMSEVKPYNAKIREYKDGKSPPMETIGVIQPGDIAPSSDCANQIPCLPGIPGEDLIDCLSSSPSNPNAGLRSVSDFDKPPYVDTATGEIRVLDDRDPADQVILTTDPDYVNYSTVPFKGDDPVRRSNISIHWDRTNWQLTQFAWNASTTTVSESIARNIADVMAQSDRDIMTVTGTYRAADRIFKSDVQVQEQFVRDLRNHFDVYDSQTGHQAGDFFRYPGADRLFDLYQVISDIMPGTSFDEAQQSVALLAEPYSEVFTDTELLTAIVESGSLNFTLALVKSKVGGDYQAEWLDADLFSRLVPGGDDFYDYNQILGYDTLDYETFYWDIVDRVNNYVGIFREPPEANLRRDDRDADGFDAHTFLRTLYGEERPEELVYVDPYESLIINVYTDVGSNTVITGANIALDANGSITGITLPDDFAQRSYGSVQATVFVEDDTGANANIQVNTQDIRVVDLDVLDGGTGYSSNTTVTLRTELNDNARPVEFQMVYGLFGNTDYVRVRNKATLEANVHPWTEEITVSDPDIFPDPTPDIPGFIWLDRELIRYERKSGNVLSVLQRGYQGTTITDHPAVSTVAYPGHQDEQFNQLDPERAVWLEIGARYDQFYDYDDPDYASTPGTLGSPGFDHDEGNVLTVADNIPYDYANVSGQTALSLADRANADPRARDSIMKFLHNIPTAFDDPPGFNP